jgi:predicted nucleotide-binding protein (sugar kinase/HSP70/actin superfamily)
MKRTLNDILTEDFNEVSEREIEEMYKEMLDDCYPEIDICGYKYSPSNALESVDPVAFNCGLNDYTSSDFVEVIMGKEVKYYTTSDYDDAVEMFEDQEEEEEEEENE